MRETSPMLGLLIRIGLSVFALTLAAGFAPGAAAQTWPAKTVKLIAVFPPIPPSSWPKSVVGTLTHETPRK